jgi:hypothetical protein
MAEPYDEDQFDSPLMSAGTSVFARHRFVTAWRTDTGVDIEQGSPEHTVLLSIKAFS